MDLNCQFLFRASLFKQVVIWGGETNREQEKVARNVVNGKKLILAGRKGA